MGVRLSHEECLWIHETWHQAFPAFREWKARVRAELKQYGYIETATGFRRHFGDFNAMLPQQQAEAVREAMNCKSQTLAAHIAYIGVVDMHQAGLSINGFFHDAVSFETYVPEDRPQIEASMTQRPVQVLQDVFGVAFSVPLVIKSSLDP
jgi:DNA polymerase I-like protein with 3'-5' exonuclease and polymerase domains